MHWFDSESIRSNDVKNENIFIIPRRKRIPDSVKCEDQYEVRVDGTKWENIKEVFTSGRERNHFTFKANNVHAGVAKKNIVKGKVRSFFLEF